MTQAPPADLCRRFERLRLATPQGMESLAASIRAEGILSPLATVEIDGRVEVVDGFKRLRLAFELRLETVPVTTLSLPNRPAIVAAVLTLNTRARSVTGLDEALVIRALSEEDRLSLAEIAALIGRDKSFCSRRLKLGRDLDVALVQRVRDGSLSVSVATMLAPLPRGNQLALAESIIREGLSARETERLMALAATTRGREAEILLAQPRAAIGRLERKHPVPNGSGLSEARSGLLRDIGRATESLARVARGLVQSEAAIRDPRIEPALTALGAQIAVVETQLRLGRDDKPVLSGVEGAAA